METGTWTRDFASAHDIRPGQYGRQLQYGLQPLSPQPSPNIVRRDEIAVQLEPTALNQ